MIKKLFATTAVLMLLSAPAYAGKCTEAIEMVEKVLMSDHVTDEDRLKVGDLLAKANQQQAAGDNIGCVTLLAEARKLLKLN